MRKLKEILTKVDAITAVQKFHTTLLTQLVEQLDARQHAGGRNKIFITAQIAAFEGMMRQKGLDPEPLMKPLKQMLNQKEK